MSEIRTWARLDRRERRLLLVLGGASFFQQYDEGLLSLLLVHIQADLGIADGVVGWIGSLVRLGAVPALAILLLADRVGRRSVLLVSIAGYTVCTAATALAPDTVWFVTCQLLARVFLAVEFGLAIVVVVEELRPDNRALGVAVLGTLAVCGRGLGMILFGFVETIPFGWRGLYAVGVVPLLLLAMLRRGLPETRRFSELAGGGAGAAREGWLRPFALLVRRYPLRFAAVSAVAFLGSFANAPVDFFLPKFAQEVHGFKPGHFATVAVLGGALGLSGQLLAGWIADRYGRKPSAICFFVLEPAAAILLYSAGLGLFVAVYVGWVFSSVANDVLRRTYAGELFPTAARSTALGAVGLVATLGGVLGLACEGALFAVFGAHWTPVRILAATGLLMPILVAVAFPETRGRSLEQIAPAEGPPPAALGS